MKGSELSNAALSANSLISSRQRNKDYRPSSQNLRTSNYYSTTSKNFDDANNQKSSRRGREIAIINYKDNSSQILNDV